MQTQVQDFQTPALQPEAEPQYRDEMATHYGILVGGFPEISWPDTGPQSIGHQAIVRRKWMTFNALRVGRRPEFDGALDHEETAIQLQWSTNPERIVTKSPRACAIDVLTRHKQEGYCVPKVMVGHFDPQGLADRVWPLALRESQRLFQNIQYFETFSSDNEQEAALAAELLGAHYLCREYVAEYVRVLKQEMNKEHGLKTLNGALEELFHEINEPLPERKNLAIAQEMGRAVAGDGKKDDAVVNVLNAIAARLEALEKPGLTEETNTAGVSNTQPGVNKDGSPDRRFKANKESE